MMILRLRKENPQLLGEFHLQGNAFARSNPVTMDSVLDLGVNRLTVTFAMRLTVNGEPQDVPDSATVAALLQHLGLSGPVAVERNSQVIPRAEHETVELESEDIIEIVHFVGGG
jgi:sulfur carrier protein